MKQILIIEDNENLSRGIAFAFEKDGYSVATASTLKAGQARFEQNDIDIVILDLSLPDGNGMALCKKIREKSNTPVIMLTACDLETDEVAGLMAGADDYVTKPFSLAVLRARVETILRRIEAKDSQEIQLGKYKLDIKQTISDSIASVIAAATKKNIVVADFCDTALYHDRKWSGGKVYLRGTKSPLNTFIR